MIIDWFAVGIGLIVWIVVAAVLILPFDDYTNWEHSLHESFARTILWPVAAPILLVRGLVLLLGWLRKVLSEIPEAVSDLWRWKF